MKDWSSDREYTIVCFPACLKGVCGMKCRDLDSGDTLEPVVLQTEDKMNPCPVCGFKGGFHDTAKHNKVDAPKEFILEKAWFVEFYEELRRERAVRSFEYGGRNYSCEVCNGFPTWRLDRRGDAVVSWSCSKDLHSVMLRLQRDHEVTEVVVRSTVKLSEERESSDEDRSSVDLDGQ